MMEILTGTGTGTFTDDNDALMIEDAEDVGETANLA